MSSCEVDLSLCLVLMVRARRLLGCLCGSGRLSVASAIVFVSSKLWRYTAVGVYKDIVCVFLLIQSVFVDRDFHVRLWCVSGQLHRRVSICWTNTLEGA